MADFEQLTTADGRTLEYLDSGAGSGRPLLFHVGTPNCATEFSFISHAAAELGLRLIGYSRPGYAGSGEQRGRRVADAATDALSVLDALGIEQFLTAGWSGGGPHALACAALLPQRCQAAAVIAGVAPYDAAGIDFLAGMDQANLGEFGAALTGPAELTAFLEVAGAELSQVTGESVVAAMAGLLPPVDQQAMTGTFAEEMAATFRRAMSAGVAGWRDDDLAFVTDWGFRCSEITVPVAIWQGAQDRMVPFAHGQWLAGEIPSAQPHLFGDEGHVSLIAQVSTIFADLIELADGR